MNMTTRRRMLLGGGTKKLPTEWKISQVLTATGVWKPEKNKWYRIHLYGKCADGKTGGRNGASYIPDQNGAIYSQTFWGGYGGAGGGTGGVAVHIFFSKNIESINITVDTSIVSFGNECSVTCGGGINAGTASGSENDTLYNGFKGGTGGRRGQETQINHVSQTNPTDGSKGENDGGDGGSKYENGGGGGGGARMYQNGMKYASLTGGGDGGMAGTVGSSAGNFDINNPISYGGGGGGGGARRYGQSSSGPTEYGKDGGAGSPGFIVIEEGA